MEKAKAEQCTQNFKDLGQLARENVLAERAPDVAESYFQEVGDAVGHSEVYIDAQAVQDLGLAESLAQLSPAFASKFQEALQTGGEVAIPAGEYLARIARSEINDDLAPLLHLADEPSLHQMEGMEDERQASEQAPQEGAEEPQADNPVVDIADAVSQAIDQVAEGLAGQQPAEQNKQLARQNAQSAEQNAQVAEPIANRLERVRPKETSNEIKVLTKEIASVFEKSGAPKTEQAAMTGLCLSLAMIAAQDLGMTPTEFWRAHGLKLAASPAQANAAGIKQADGSKGEFFPGQNIIVRWASADPSTLVHESGHWFLHNRIKIAEDLENKAKTQELTEGEKHYLDATKAALKWLGVLRAVGRHVFGTAKTASREVCPHLRGLPYGWTCADARLALALPSVLQFPQEDVLRSLGHSRSPAQPADQRAFRQSLYCLRASDGSQNAPSDV